MGHPGQVSKLNAQRKRNNMACGQVSTREHSLTRRRERPNRSVMVPVEYYNLVAEKARLEQCDRLMVIERLIEQFINDVRIWE